MYDFLKQYAIKNIWCSPAQDRQIILAAQRITKDDGERGSAQVMMRRIGLPTADRRYHVFQIGQAHPSVLGLLPNDPDWSIAGWRSFSDTVNRLSLFCDLYTDIGVHIPLFRSYYMYTNNRALIFAIDLTSKAPVDLDLDQIYLRVYSNAFYESSEGTALAATTKTQGQSTRTTNDILAVQAACESYLAKPGYVYSYINGTLAPSINLITVTPGDDIEFIYDASVKKVVDLQIKSLLSFRSELDSMYKYLVHYPQEGVAQIDFVDDIDVYVLSKATAVFKGRFLHRNREENLRMVTHHDYAVAVDSFEVIANALASHLDESGSMNVQDFYLRVIVRKSGLSRPLAMDDARLFELYKLNEADLTQAMVGTNAVVPCWEAAALESNGYSELMRCQYSDINIELIDRALGYNAIAKLIGDTPTKAKTSGSMQVVELPLVGKNYSTIYEYTEAGALLGVYTHDYGDFHQMQSPGAVYAEVIAGIGSHSPSVSVGTDNLTIPIDHSYRVYMCYLEDGQPNNAWKDITGSEHYTVVNERLIWAGLEHDQWLMVRTDQHFLGYSLSVAPVAGITSFNLTEVINEVEQDMTVPMKELDIWLNGMSLIEGLEYIVDFPKVTIIGKQHLAQPADTAFQQITVRFTGFCEPDLSRKPASDYGFIQHGFLSNNDQFDLRDDKVLRITVGGLLKDRTAVKFSEEHAGVSITDALNGQPYQVRDCVIPLRNHTEQETYALRAHSVVIDKMVKDYLSLKLPQPERPAISAIPNRQVLISPFLCRLINDIKTGVFYRPALDAVLTDGEVIQLCLPYEGYLKDDPMGPDVVIDERFVVIHPTSLYSPIAVDLESYRFIKRVVEIYGQGRVILSPHLVIG